MNAEESCARGATIMCAILSPTFEFNEFKIEDTHQFSDSIIFNCMHCSQYVIKKEFVNLPSAIKVICGNCPLSVIETGDFERKNCALFDRSSIFCFICRKSGYDIKLNKTYTTTIICMQCSNIIRNRKNDKQTEEKKKKYNKLFEQAKWKNAILKLQCEICFAFKSPRFHGNILCCSNCWVRFACIYSTKQFDEIFCINLKSEKDDCCDLLCNYHYYHKVLKQNGNLNPKTQFNPRKTFVGVGDFNSFLKSIQNDYKVFHDQQKKLNLKTFNFDRDAEEEDEADNSDGDYDGEEGISNAVNLKYSHSDLHKLKYQEIKFGIVNNLFQAENVLDTALKHAENVNSDNHLNGMLILLFYYTGVRPGVLTSPTTLLTVSNKPDSGIGVLSLDTACFKFLDSNVIQLAFWGKAKFPTNIRFVVSHLIYDNLKSFHTRAIQNDQKYLFFNMQPSGELGKLEYNVNLYFKRISQIENISVKLIKSLRLTTMAQKYLYNLDLIGEYY